MKREMDSLRAYLLLFVNAAILLIVYHLTRLNLPLPQDLFGVPIYPRFMMINSIIYVIVSIFHIVISHVILNDLVLTIINRLVLLLYTLNMISILDGHLSVFIDLGLLLGAPFILRLLGLEISIQKTTRVLKSFVSGELRPRGLAVESLPLVLSSHGLSVAIYQLLLFFIIMNGDIGVLESNLPYFIGIGVICPLVLLVLVAFSSNTNVQSQSILSGFGLLGLPALLTLIPTSHKWMSKMYSKALYLFGPGIMLGEALYVLSYDYPSKTCISMIDEIRGKTWCWRSIHHPIYLRLEELNTPHIVIVGASGSGKTTLAKRIIYESRRVYGFNVIILDQHGEYKEMADQLGARVIDASIYVINPLSLEGTSPRERSLQLAHIIAQYFRLGFKQRQLLEDIILRTYYKRGIKQEDPTTWNTEPPRIEDLVETCRSLAEEISEYNRILPYLSLLQQSLGSGSYVDPGEVISGNTIIDLSKVPDDFTRTLYIDTIMYFLINYMYKRKLSSKVQIVLEEAREIIPREISRDLLSRLFAESRKFGFSILVITQELQRVPRALVNNAGLRVFFVLNEPEEIEEASRILAGSEFHEKTRLVSETIRRLDPHVFIAHATGTSEVYIVKTTPSKESTYIALS